MTNFGHFNMIILMIAILSCCCCFLFACVCYWFRLFAFGTLWLTFRMLFSALPRLYVWATTLWLASLRRELPMADSWAYSMFRTCPAVDTVEIFVYCRKHSSLERCPLGRELWRPHKKTCPIHAVPCTTVVCAQIYT